MGVSGRIVSKNTLLVLTSVEYALIRTIVAVAGFPLSSKKRFLFFYHRFRTHFVFTRTLLEDCLFR